MNEDEIIAAFGGLTQDEKIRLLLHLSCDLTLFGRDAYEVGTLDLVMPARLRRINEHQHRISGFILCLLDDDPDRYPDDVLLRMVLGDEDDGELQEQIRTSLVRLLAGG